MLLVARLQLLSVLFHIGHRTDMTCEWWSVVLPINPSHPHPQVDFLEARDAWLADSASRAGAAGDLQHALSGSSSSSPYQVKVGGRPPFKHLAHRSFGIFIAGAIIVYIWNQVYYAFQPWMWTVNGTNLRFRGINAYSSAPLMWDLFCKSHRI